MFKDVLQKINEQVKGAFGVLIVARDGIIIEQVTQSSDIVFELLAAEFVSIIKAMRRFSKNAEMGDLHEATLHTDKARILAKIITDEYYLLLVLSCGANQGRARYELRKAHQVLEREFAV